MAEVFREQFGAGQGVILGVQATGSSDHVAFEDLQIRDIHLNQTNLAPKRTGAITVLIVANQGLGDPSLLIELQFRFDLTDEAYDQRTLQGYAKKRNPEAVIN